MRTRTVRVALFDGIVECKGGGCARRESRQSSMYVSGQILKLRCMTTFPLRGYPNFTITKRVGLWAREHLN